MVLTMYESASVKILIANDGWEYAFRVRISLAIVMRLSQLFMSQATQCFLMGKSKCAWASSSLAMLLVSLCYFDSSMG